MRRKFVKQLRCARAVLLVLMVTRTVHAQEWSFGVRGGPSIPRLSGGGNEVSRGYSSILAPNFGLVAERSFSSRFSVLAEVDYSGQGGERRGLQPVTQDLPLPPPQGGQYYYADFTNRSELDYLEIPILAKYEWPVDCQNQSGSERRNRTGIDEVVVVSERCRPRVLRPAALCGLRD